MTKKLSPVQGKLFSMQVMPRKTIDEPIEKFFGWYFHPTLQTFQMGFIKPVLDGDNNIVSGTFIKAIPEDFKYFYDADSQSIMVNSEANVGKTFNPTYLSGESEKMPSEIWDKGEAILPFTQITSYKYGLVWNPTYESLMATNKLYFVPSDNIDLGTFEAFFKRNLEYTEMDMGNLQESGSLLYQSFLKVAETGTANLLSWNLPQTILMGTAKLKPVKKFTVL